MLKYHPLSLIVLVLFKIRFNKTPCEFKQFKYFLNNLLFFSLEQPSFQVKPITKYNCVFLSFKRVSFKTIIRLWDLLQLQHSNKNTTQFITECEQNKTSRFMLPRKQLVKKKMCALWFLKWTWLLSYYLLVCEGCWAANHEPEDHLQSSLAAVARSPTKPGIIIHTIQQIQRLITEKLFYEVYKIKKIKTHLTLWI